MIIPIFLIPLITGSIIQIIKLIIDKYRWDNINFDKLFTAWWFPSVHSGLSTSLLITIAYVDGVYSSFFAISLIFSILFWYDASNVRYQAWKHAEVLNKMRNELSNIFALEYSNTVKLQERLWHTIIEVVWWIIISAIITLIIIYTLNYFWISFK